MSAKSAILSPDYAQFTIENGVVYPGPRMNKKIEAIPFPKMEGKTVLDIGCDYGQFSFLCASWGAKVLGLDRNRDVRGVGHVDLIETNRANAQAHGFNCEFENINLGKQWREFGKFDFVLCMSMYHHFFEQCGDHRPIWFWLWRHCREAVIWENPVDYADKVVTMNVKREGYNRKAIIDAASVYFNIKYIGAANHEPHRHVYIFTPKTGLQDSYCITPRNGMGGASKAFELHNQRRMDEIEKIVGYRPHPGTLNVTAKKEFNFDWHYYPGMILDMTDRTDPDSAWEPRETRFYPATINGVKCHAMRMRGEKYPYNFIELIAPTRLRDIEDIRELIICG